MEKERAIELIKFNTEKTKQWTQTALAKIENLERLIKEFEELGIKLNVEVVDAKIPCFIS